MPAFDKLRIVNGRLLYVFDEPSFDPQAELRIINQRKNVGIAIQRRFDVIGVSAAGQAATLNIFVRTDASVLIPSVVVVGEAAILASDAPAG